MIRFLVRSGGRLIVIWATDSNQARQLAIASGNTPDSTEPITEAPSGGLPENAIPINPPGSAAADELFSVIGGVAPAGGVEVPVGTGGIPGSGGALPPPPPPPQQFLGVPESELPQAAFLNFAQGLGLPTGTGGGVLGGAVGRRFPGAEASFLANLALQGINDPSNIGTEFSSFLGNLGGVGSGALNPLETSGRSLSAFNQLLGGQGGGAAQRFLAPANQADFGITADLALDAARQRFGGFAGRLLPGGAALTSDFLQQLQGGQAGGAGFLPFLQQRLGLA